MGTYAKAFEIPEDFPSILREFTKEAIRQQPDTIHDIYKFGRDYFDKLSTGETKHMYAEDLPDGVGSDSNSNQRDSNDELGVIALAGVNKVETQKVSGTGSGSSPMPDDALSDRIALLFQEADTDRNGTLSRAEFQAVLEMFGASIGLTPKQVLKIMAEADNNDNGVIEYAEFLPVATEIIQAIIAKEQYSDNKVIRTRRASAKLEVQDFLVKGLPRNELEASIQKIFRGADRDGSGALDRSEFLRCLKESGLGFTRRELNLVQTLIDKNSDGIIDYQEFMPVCFSMIVEILSDKVQEIPEEEVMLSDLVYDLLLKDGGNNKRLAPSAASECLLHAGLGLRFVQVPAIMSAVEEGGDGLVAAKEVADAVAGVMCALKELDNRQRESPEDETVHEFKASRHTEGFAKAAGLNAEEFEEKLVGVFKSKDDGDTLTLATKDAIRDAIKEAFPDLEPRQVHALSSLAEPREDGRFGYERVKEWGFRTLQEIQDQNILRKTVKVSVAVE